MPTIPLIENFLPGSFLAGCRSAGRYLDQSLLKQLTEKLVQVLAEPRGRNVKLGKQGLVCRLDGGSVVEYGPEAGTDWIEPEIEFALQIQDYGFVADDADHYVRGGGDAR